MKAYWFQFQKVTDHTKTVACIRHLNLNIFGFEVWTLKLVFGVSVYAKPCDNSPVSIIYR